MRKWLNIKPKLHEFSEDEVDTESEDDGMIFLSTLFVSGCLCPSIEDNNLIFFF